MAPAGLSLFDILRLISPMADDLLSERLEHRLDVLAGRRGREEALGRVGLREPQRVLGPNLAFAAQVPFVDSDYRRALRGRLPHALHEPVQILQGLLAGGIAYGEDCRRPADEGTLPFRQRPRVDGPKNQVDEGAVPNAHRQHDFFLRHFRTEGRDEPVADRVECGAVYEASLSDRGPSDNDDFRLVPAGLHEDRAR